MSFVRIIQELNEFLKELKGWESTVKEKEKKIQGQRPSKDAKNSGNNPPPRKLASNSKPDGNDGQGTSRNETQVEKTPTKESKIQAEEKTQSGASSKPEKSPAGHTYDHLKDKWDKYDVDAALNELDREDEDGRPVKKASKREIRPIRGSQAKTRVDKLSEGRRKASAVSPSPPPQGKVLGGKANPMAPTSKVPASYGFDDSPPDAASEKDLGNEYFKEGKYVRAIDCYSRSIALQPTAVAYANRAMAGIKIRRFEDAEIDCTEAIALDDRYTKAYARRGSARRELKKYGAAVEDLEFALRLEPDNKELQKQYSEVEELYKKEGGGEAPKQSSPLLVKEKDEKVPPKTQQKDEKVPPKKQPPKAEQPTVAFVHTPPSPRPPPTPPTAPEVLKDAITENRPREPVHADLLSTTNKPREPPKQLLKEPAKGRDLPPGGKDPVPDIVSHIPVVAVPSKQARTRDRRMAEVVAATQAAAARAAASATAAVSRNIVAPRSSYEFELMWKGFDGNKNSQVRLLKITDPQSLPRVFKDSLSAPLLLEIIQCLELLFPQDAELAAQILENLTKVGRFNMTVMFLTSKDKTGLRHLWEEVFMKSPEEIQTRLQDLRSVYRLV